VYIHVGEGLGPAGWTCVSELSRHQCSAGCRHAAGAVRCRNARWTADRPMMRECVGGRGRCRVLLLCIVVCRRRQHARQDAGPLRGELRPVGGRRRQGDRKKARGSCKRTRHPCALAERQLTPQSRTGAHGTRLGASPDDGWAAYMAAREARLTHPACGGR
jgi:hypothetical protein